MRTMLALDDDLLAKAREYRADREAAIVRAALIALMEREAARRLARMGGADPQAKAPPRRRPPLAGIGYVDAHLSAATRLTLDVQFRTLDKRLSVVADYLGLTAEAPVGR